MIYDSVLWKNDLNTTSNKLKKLNKKKITDKTFYNLEKYFFYSAYALRKLHQSFKISDEVFKKDIVLYYYKPLKKINLRNCWDASELYNFDEPIKSSIQLSYMLNQIIHSYTFIPILNKKGTKIRSVLVHSDKLRNKKTYEIKLNDYIRILDKVSNHYPSEFHMGYNEKTEEYDVLC